MISTWPNFARSRPDALDDVLAVAVGGVDDEHVAAGLQQLLGAPEIVDADRGADAEAPPLVLAGVRVLLPEIDVADRDEPRELALAVREDQLLDLVLVEELLRVLERRALRGAVTSRACGRHDVLDERGVVAQEPEVALRQDADDAAPLDDRHSAHVVREHQLARLAHARGRAAA